MEKKIKGIALATVIIGGCSLLCLILVMLALQDIYHSKEDSLITEWQMIRIGFIVFWIFHVLFFLTSFFVIRLKWFRR